MELIRKINKNFNNTVVSLIQLVLNNIAIGLGLAWLVLLILELIRPGIVSIHLDLNLILLLALGVWIISVIKPLPNSASS